MSDYEAVQRPAALAVSELTVGFGGVTVLQGVDVQLQPSDRLGVIGPNGAGKSTLINAICGDVPVRHGRISLFGKDLAGTGVANRARLGIGRTYQHLSLFNEMTVRDNVRCAVDAPKSKVRVNIGEPQVRPSTEDLLERFGLNRLSDAVIATIPYGSRKMVELCRAFALQPAVLILDEPAAGLDTHEKVEIANVILRELAGTGIAMLLVEHDMATVRRLCTSVQALVEGRTIAAGTFDQVTANVAVVDAYLGTGNTARAGSMAPNAHARHKESQSREFIGDE